MTKAKFWTKFYFFHLVFTEVNCHQLNTLSVRCLYISSKHPAFFMWKSMYMFHFFLFSSYEFVLLLFFYREFCFFFYKCIKAELVVRESCVVIFFRNLMKLLCFIRLLTAMFHDEGYFMWSYYEDWTRKCLQSTDSVNGTWEKLRRWLALTLSSIIINNFKILEFFSPKGWGWNTVF